MSNFLAILEQVYKTTSDQVRNEAESKIREYMLSRPREFLEECIANFQKGDLNPSIKQIISVLLCKSITEKTCSIHWSQIPDDIKENIKRACFSQLISDNDRVLKSAGQLIAVMFTLQYVENKWGDLLDNLSSNTSNNNLNIVKASIYTIQYICESFQQEKIQLRTSEEM